MDKQHILDEIRRTAEANGGKPLGAARLAAETGIRHPDWGRHWKRLSDAHRELGDAPNELNKAIPTSQLLEQYAVLAIELGHLPTAVDLRFKARDSNFPSPNVFSRFGKKHQLIELLSQFCLQQGGYEAVLHMCEQYVPPRCKARVEVDRSTDDAVFGFVYLLKSGRNYKIGHSNSTGRRQYELKIQLPDAAELVHEIRTDDPPGIEAYWHKRFDEKRKNGEWFDLNAADVAAFKRRKFM